MPSAAAFLDDTATKAEDFLGPEPETTPGAVPEMLHTAFNAVREFGTGAGRYIFHGLQGLNEENARLIGSIDPTGADRLRNDAEYWKKRAENVGKEGAVDPTLAETMPARIARSSGEAALATMEAFAPGGGLPLMMLHGGAATYASAKDAGATNEEADSSAARSAIGLGIFGAANKGAALGVAKLLGDDPAPLAKFIAQFAGQGYTNETVTRALSAWEAAKQASPGDKLRAATEAFSNQPIESHVLNAVFAAHGAAESAGAKGPVKGGETNARSTEETTTEVPGFARYQGPSRTGGAEAPAAAQAPGEPGAGDVGQLATALEAEQTASQGLGSAPAAAANPLESIPAGAQERAASAPEATGSLADVGTQTDTPNPQPAGQSQPADAGDVVKVPTSQIAVRPDLMQFKEATNDANGTNAADQITAPYDPVKASNLLLWEPVNPKEYGLKNEQKYIVANGHHRHAKAIADEITLQNAQILRESAGYSAGDARAKGAEANIADGKGTIYDAVAFIRNEAATHGEDAALARAGQIGARGRKAATIAIAGTPDLHAAFVNERITPETAAAVSMAAPKDPALQRLGIQRALKGDQPAEVANFLQAVKASTGEAPTASQVDLFGSDDSAIRAAEAAGKRAGALQKEIGEQIAAVQGAAKRPEKARALGVDVRDPAALEAKLNDLKLLRERARMWHTDPEIRGAVLGGDQGASELVKQLGGEAAQTSTEPTPTLRPGEKGTGDLFQSAEAPFNLAGESGPDNEAKARQLEAEQKAAHDKAVWEEQNQVPFGFGPGAAAAGENLRIGSQIKQLTGTVTTALRTPAPGPVTGRMTRVFQKIGGAFVSAKQSIQSAANGARASWLVLKNGYLRPPVIGEFREAVKDWQGTDQRTSFEVRKFVQELRRQIRDPLKREAITNYIQADGDLNVLSQRAAASNIKYRPGYEAAMRLTNDEQTLAANVRQYFDAMLADGVNAGILDHGIENYINQVWKRPNRITQEMQAAIQAGRLQTSFQFARKRIFDSFFTGEQAGYVPATKDVSALVAAYDLSFNRALAARGLIKALREAKAPGGDPIAKFSGMVQPVPKGAEPPEAYLIRSRALPQGAVTMDGRKYEIVDHPALRGWKFVVQGDGHEVPSYHQVDMLVHPDYAPQLRNILGTSAFRVGKLGAVTSPILKVGAFAKQTKLSLSVFHLDQEGLHGLFHRVNPANLERINFDDPKQWSLVRNGLQIADYQAMELFAEGLRGGGLVSKIPVLGKLQDAFNQWLFKDIIPRLKMTMALHAYERNVSRYGKQLTPDQIAELTANQGNAAFGELNYKLMARHPGVQDFLRLTVLAPDFLEARSKFVGQALKPYGREQRAALFLMGASLYVTGRILNQWLDNDPHWDRPFTVIHNGREYRLRTVLGDLGELISDPRRFFYNRFSPWLKTGYTVWSGRDYRGVKLDNLEIVKDALSWLVPIPLGGNEPASPAQRFLGSAGVSNKPAPTAIDDAYKWARKYKEGLRDPKIQQEVRRAQQETYAQADYAPLNRALRENDREKAVNEIVNLMREKGKDIDTIEQYYDNLPDKPFTGSMDLEDSFVRSLDQAHQARYKQAVAMREQMAKLFFALSPYAQRAARQRR